MADKRVSLKLMIDMNNNRVLFAEADKTFVDFLFSLLSLPLATVVTLVTKEAMAGCFGNLYDSVENLSCTHLQANLNRDSLLKPTVPLCSHSQAPLRQLFPNIQPSPISRKVIYRCVNNGRPVFGYGAMGGVVRDCRHYVAEHPTAICPICNGLMKDEAVFAYPPATAKKEASCNEDGGYVKGVVTYMVMDDLTVKPMSTISSITLLNNLKIKDLSVLEERVIYLDPMSTISSIIQGVKLLSVALASETVLTDVFLKVGR